MKEKAQRASKVFFSKILGVKNVFILKYYLALLVKNKKNLNLCINYFD